MTTPLSPCSTCRRHVRVTERACPFCGAEAPSTAPALKALPRPSARLGTLALMTFRAAAVGMALGACGAVDDDGDDRPQGGKAGAGGGNVAGSRPDDVAGSGGTTGGAPVIGGSPAFGGSPEDGGRVAIYRAAPRG